MQNSSQEDGGPKPFIPSRRASAKTILLFAVYTALCMAFAKLVLFA